MDVQGYIAPLRPEDAPLLHYAKLDLSPIRHPSPTPAANFSRMTSAFSDYNAPPSTQFASSTRSSSRPSPLKTETATPPAASTIPAYLTKKRKSSPAILGLPLGLNDERQTKLRLHLSKQRNSIEAAMLLANFNRQTSDNRLTPVVEKDSHWSDEEADATSEPLLPHGRSRRYSHDVTMKWETMPPLFIEQSKFFQIPPSLSSSSSSSSSQVSHQRHHTAGQTFKAPRVSDYELTKAEPGPTLHPHPHTHHHLALDPQPNLPPHPMQHIRPPHPNMAYPPATHQAQHQMVHPLAATAPEASQKRESQGEYYPYPPYGSAPPFHPMTPTSSDQQQHLIQQSYYYQQHHGKLPLPGPLENHGVGMMPNPALPYSQLPGPAIKPAKRKKTQADEEEEMTVGIEPGHPDFPDMSLKDIEAARTDVDARPRRQKLRYEGDKYTPQWVRYNGQAKEGLCDTCKPGKWLQLKNSAFWYHKQFFHGISSVSGKEFMQPVESRWVDQDLLEGLCHQCHQWVSVSNVKRKNSVLWYRHAHKCHVYHKPKATTPKRR